jgi:hypothetical protein
MLKQRDIRSFLATYHRNGISGEGFYLCTFALMDGSQRVPLRAVVFDRSGYIAIFSENCVQKWRGDEFEPFIRRLLPQDDAAVSAE